MELRRFWFEIESTADTPGVPFGCGVTAPTVDEALDLVADAYCGGRRPRVGKLVEDVDIGELADELAPRVQPLVMGLPFAPGTRTPQVRSQRAGDRPVRDAWFLAA